MKREISLLLGAVLILFGLAGCGARETIPEETGEPLQTGEPDQTSEFSSPVEQEESAEIEDSAEEAFPDPAWEFDEPENHGVNSGSLEAIHQRIAGSQMLAVVIVKDGAVIDEFYQDGYDENSLFHMHSVTKSVMGALIGIAIDQGILTGADVTLAEYFPQLADPDDARKQEVTIAHLLAHTSGFGRGDSEQSFRALVESESWVDYYLSLSITAEPGTTFDYSTAGSHMLSAVLERASGISTQDYAAEHLFGPLGIEAFEWDRDPQGVTDGGNGLHLTARDAAKIGQLYLEEGNWRGMQLVPQAWVEESTRVQSAGEPDKGEYGYQWWIRSFGANGEYSGYYALGYAGQFVFVVPELNLVTAVASKSIWNEYTAQICFNEIIAACDSEIG